jgi:hypothetical protein
MALNDFVWLAVFRHGPLSAAALDDLLPYPVSALQAALSALVAEGRIERVEGGDAFRAGSFTVPVGATAGWEAAVFDHFQTVALAIAAKLGIGEPRSEADDTTGGATLVFDVSAGHPHRAEVRGLLRRIRAEVNELWERVEAHNEAHPLPPDEAERVAFYFGQHAHGHDGRKEP